MYSKMRHWKVDSRSLVLLDSSKLVGRFFFAIKDEGTERKIWKARIMAQGYPDKMKNSIVHDTVTER